MKLSLDPMPVLRTSAAAKINAHFDRQAMPHREAAWAAKRIIAHVILSNKAVPEYHVGAARAFGREAELRGVSTQSLAYTVLDKPDIAAERELERQKALLKLETLSTPAEIDTLLNSITKV
jgi:hypothetical protein